MPAKESRPGMSGIAISLNMPMALTTTSAEALRPDASSSVHCAAASSQRARRTASPKRQCGSSPYFSAQCSR